jgi:hypothetical protein
MSCDTGSCETNKHANECCDSGHCETSCHEDSCPLECGVNMWRESFFEAMKQAQVEILKAKMLKAWGPMMDQAADALLVSMDTCWQSKIAEIKAAEAHHSFEEKLKSLWLNAKK